MPITSPIGLLALLAIAPLIILYLLRPRPRRLVVPSLMFFVGSEQIRRVAVVSHIIRDPLFYLHALIIVLIAIALAGPYIMGETGAPIVIVIDSSASMQAGGFDEAIDLALNSLGDHNTIILAGNIPVELVRDASPEKAREALLKAKPGSTSADLSAAMRLAHTLGGDARLLVISDFHGYTGETVENMAKLLEEAGMDICLAIVGATADNVGVVDGWIEHGDGAYGYRFTIKNYGQPTSITVKAESTGGVLLTQEVSLDNGASADLLIENLPRGVSTIHIKPGGAITSDDEAHVSIPPGIPPRVLYVGPAGPAVVALEAAGANVTVADSLPEKLPYHMIIIDAPVDPESLRDYVEYGGSAVFIANEGFLGVSSSLLPVRAIDILNVTSMRPAARSPITQDVDFTAVPIHKHLRTTPAEGAAVLVTAVDSSPMLAYKTVDKGRVVYLGLTDTWADFHARRDYPVFWSQLTAWLTGMVDVADLNKQAGDRESLGEKRTVQTPSGEITTTYLYYSDAGVYEVNSKKVAVNMYDPGESDLRTQRPPSAYTEFDTGKQLQEAPVNLTYIPLALIFPLLLLELIILRRRGEL